MTAIDWKRFEKGEFLSRLYPSLPTGVEFEGDEIDVSLNGQSKLVARASFGMVGGVSAYLRGDLDPATF